MARTLDKKKPYVEVFGEVDANEVDKEGRHHIPHRYRQYGMMFGDQGELIGEERDIPPDEESPEMMRDRIKREVRAEIEEEQRIAREKAASAAALGGGEPSVDPDSELTSSKPRRKGA